MKQAPLSYNAWVKIGERMKVIRAEVISLQCDTRLQTRMTKKQMDGFRKALNGIDNARSECEETMFRDIADQYVDTHPLIDVFYGNDRRPEPEKKVQ
jgi:hypothetical protein